MECKQLIRKEYTFQVLHQGKRPASVKAFVHGLGLTEKDFYHLYPSFSELEKDIFASFLEETVALLQQDPAFKQYSSVEKIIAFYYAWFEKLNMHRSFINFIDKQRGGLVTVMDYLPLGGMMFKYLLKQALTNAPAYLLKVYKPYKQFLAPIVNEAVGEDLAPRFWISGKYDELFWAQAMFLYRFWLNDKSPSFEQTDIAIEKSTAFILDLLRPNMWDTGFDLVKFLVQKPKN
jgi:hypothetical protein